MKARRRFVHCLLPIAYCLLLITSSAASDTPPWVAPGEFPLPSSIKSVRILKQDQPLFDAPFAKALRRGSVTKNVHLPVFAARGGDGCRGRWFEVGPLAWVCEDTVELSSSKPILPFLRTWQQTSDGLPFQYYFVGPDGTFGYRRIASADIEEPDVQLEPGFAVAIVEERAEGGTRYGRTNKGFWVPMRELGLVHAFIFQGVDVNPDTTQFSFGWVFTEKARIYKRSSTGFVQTTSSRPRFDRVPIFEEVQSFSGTFVRVEEGSDAGWVSMRDLRRPTISLPPPEVNTEVGERWIDIDLATQTLVAYEGTQVVFTTLVSTGKGKKGSTLETPVGTYRIWAKLLSSDMDNLEDEDAARYYRMEDVPYVQYFSKGVGLHGAFWHRSFGRTRSHGCVNMTPLDAQKLFWWTSPHLPSGWTAVLPTVHEPGTAVRVR